MTHAAPPPSTRRRLKWWALILGGILMITAAFVATLLAVLSRPQFGAVEEIDPAAITGMQAVLINPPDETGTDVGRLQGTIPIPPEQFAAVLAPLRNGTPVGRDGDIWLGKVLLDLADGRKATVMLYWVRRGPKAPVILRFTVGGNRYEGGEAAGFIALLRKIEGR